MTKRKQLGKKVRFEIFKRDKFTCQYCGNAAPDVTLHVDHIIPVIEGGTNDITNLITSCMACNLGKGPRTLSDDSVVKAKKRQLDELQERREQIEMMLDWQRGLLDLDGESINAVCSFWGDLVDGLCVNEHGKASLRKTIAKYGLAEVLESVKISVSQYLKYDEDGIPDRETASKAFEYIDKICKNRKKNRDKPYMIDLYYSRGIIKNRFGCSGNRQWQVMQMMEKAVLSGVETYAIKEAAVTVGSWAKFKEAIAEMTKENTDE